MPIRITHKRPERKSSPALQEALDLNNYRGNFVPDSDKRSAALNERGKLVIQGSLAYAAADSLPDPVERFIPVDIYLDKWLPKEIVDISFFIDGFFRALGFEFLAHPDILGTSTRIRAAVQTGPMTAKEFARLERLVPAALQHIKRGPHESGEGINLDDAELQKTLAEIANIQAETTKTKIETDLAKAEIEKTKAETVKAKEGRRGSSDGLP